LTGISFYAPELKDFTKMSNNPVPKNTTFGSTMSFDLEQSPQPKRRKRKTELVAEQPSEFTPSEHGIDCPGCGSNMDENEWLQALVGFVSGARDFEVGNPVRARIVQTLHNTATNMDTPHPRDVWELSIVARLMKEIERIVNAEVLRHQAENNTQQYSLADVQHYVQAAEVETAARVQTELYGQIAEQVQQDLEPVLRRQIEAELWQEFEQELARRAEQGSVSSDE
jgi:hypothetical protein